MKSKIIGRWLVVVKDTKKFGVVVDICNKNNIVIISYTLKTFLTYGGNELKLQASNPEMTMNSFELYNSQSFAYQNQPLDMTRHINGGVAWY
jgi:hypothetical protein